MQTKSHLVSSNQIGLHPDLEKWVSRHDRTDYEKPIAEFSRETFEQILTWLNQDERPVILDSCCGTGWSTFELQKRNPECRVLGIDKSYSRLLQGRNQIQDYTGKNDQNQFDIKVGLFRGEIVDIWRLFAQNKITFLKHYILYPNPWPKSIHFKRRWQGHPVFPIISKLSNDLELRSNWKIYLDEFACAWKLLYGIKTDSKRIIPESPLTPFEKKYFESGHDLWKWDAPLTKDKS